MPSYKELLQQREQLENQIQQARSQELNDAVGKVRALVEEFSLTADDVFPPAKGKRAPTSGKKVEPKYRNPTTGETWTGRGKAPKWIAEEDDRQKFAI